MEKTNEDIEIDLIDLFYLIRARLWIIILSALIFASAAGLISSFMITPIYTSKAQLYILSKSTSLTSLADIQLGTQFTQDYMVLVKSRPVVTKVIDNLGLDMNYDQLAGIITISNPSNTRILEITANYPDAYLAKQIVDEFANVSRKQIATIMDSEEPTVVEEGFVSPTPSSPNNKRNAIIGGLLGAFLAAGIIIVLHLMDDTIKGAEDVEKYLGVSTLGLIPIESGAVKQMEIDRKRRKKHSALAKKGKGK
ncbi:MAG: Wzz/FepE/Etk N-terminal domain-containing protein [Herbinix sp.]|nr:Wzz/FepE/Etk N-terminal domain-containing protein [Herbinix sp.]